MRYQRKILNMYKELKKVNTEISEKEKHDFGMAFSLANYVKLFKREYSEKNGINC